MDNFPSIFINRQRNNENNFKEKTMANKDCSKRFRENNPEKYKEHNNSWRERNPNYQKEYMRKRSLLLGKRPKADLSQLTVEEKIAYHKEYNKQYSKQQRADNPAKQLLHGIKCRCKKKNIPFNLEIEDIIVPEVCPILGIALVVGGECFDNSPSVDRLIPALGYVKGNIIVISNRANRIRNDASSTELLMIGNFYKSIGH